MALSILYSHSRMLVNILFANDTQVSLNSYTKGMASLD